MGDERPVGHERAHGEHEREHAAALRYIAEYLHAVTHEADREAALRVLEAAARIPLREVADFRHVLEAVALKAAAQVSDTA